MHIELLKVLIVKDKYLVNKNSFLNHNEQDTIFVKNYTHFPPMKMLTNCIFDISNKSLCYIEFPFSFMLTLFSRFARLASVRENNMTAKSAN